jgi:hypothetical protein
VRGEPCHSQPIFERVFFTWETAAFAPSGRLLKKNKKDLLKFGYPTPKK